MDAHISVDCDVERFVAEHGEVPGIINYTQSTLCSPPSNLL